MERIHTIIAALHQRGQGDLAGCFERHHRRGNISNFEKKASST